MSIGARSSTRCACSTPTGTCSESGCSSMEVQGCRSWQTGCCRSRLVEAGGIGVAVETPRGPVVESLMERGLAVHSINPKQLDRFRDRFSPAGAKDDRRDARVLASALRTDAHCLRCLESTDPTIIELREWSRLNEDLTRERTRLANRMREQLWRYYPQFLAAIGDDVAAPWALELWKSLPTPRAGKRVREATLARLLEKHRIRRIDAATLRHRLRAKAIKVAPGTAEAAVAHVRLVVERLVLVNQQKVDARRQLDGLVRQLAEAAPADEPNASEETEPTDATILLSLPGIGTGVLATLLAEANDVLQRRDHAALRCLCGVAPVTRRSGKSLVVSRRLAAHDRLRDAAFHWARVAAQRDPVSHNKYRALRARGHGHARALRSIADRLINVACAMLRDRSCFDPQRAGIAAMRAGFRDFVALGGMRASFRLVRKRFPYGRPRQSPAGRSAAEDPRSGLTAVADRAR